MPSKKKKYNARFPAGRIKKIMQSDEEIGKVAQAVPIIISRTLELFIESILTKTLRITFSRNAKTLSPSHMKQCIMLVPRFDFLRELVKNVPDINMADDSSKDDDDYQSSEEELNTDSDTPQNLCIASTSKRFHHQNSNGISGNGDDAPQDLRVRAQDLRVTPQDLSLPSTSANSQLQKIPCNSIGEETASNVAVNDELHSVSSTTGLSNISGSTRYSAQLLTNPKLLRSESTPIINLQRTPHSAYLKQQQQQQHQSQSVTSTGSRPTNVSAITATLKKHSELVKQPQEPQPTAIHAPTPAPIVGIDFCSKPIVKIDYSNLQALQITSTVEDDKKPTKPVTAPANLANAFPFTVTPVISIDLSNMVTGEKISTITTTTADQTKASGTTTDKQISAAVAAPNSTSITTLGASLIQTSKNNCDLDLDEDYDNL